MEGGGLRTPETSPLRRATPPPSPLREQARSESRRSLGTTTRPTSYRRWSPQSLCSPDVDTSPKAQEHKRPAGCGYFMLMALGATGVVFGDIGTSPLYVYSGIFGSALRTQPEPEDMPGVFSMIFWAITWVVCWKYVAVVMRISHQGEGGTLALMQTILSAKQDGSQRVLSASAAEQQSEASEEESSGEKTDEEEMEIEDQQRAPFVTFLGMLGCSLIVGDGAITPVMSVLSALSGFSNFLTETWQVVLGVVILMFLFGVQRVGTRILGLFSGPVLTLWFLSLAALGLYNVIQHPKEAWTVLGGISPTALWHFCVRGRFAGAAAWRSLAGVVLAVTGAEALYADMGHFGAGPLTAAWFFLIYPSLLIQYWGQAVVISTNPSAYATAFYSSVPPALLTPMTVLATIAAILASQALISGMFSLLSQAYALQFLPRVLVMHPNPKERGQVYIPEVNWLLGLMCILLCVTFKNADALAGAYGIAVTGDFLVTTTLLSIVLVRVRKWRLLPTLLVILPMFLVDAAICSANFLKIFESGWVPVVITSTACLLMHSHAWGRRREKLVAFREVEGIEMTPSSIQGSRSINTVPQLASLLRSGHILRIGSVAVFLTPYDWRVPRSLDRVVRSLQCLPRTIILLSLHFEPVPFIKEDERVHFEVVDREAGLYRVAMHFGYAEPLTAERFAIPKRLALIALAQVGEHPGLAPLVPPEAEVASDSDVERPAKGPEEAANVTYILNRVHHAIDPEHSCWTKARATIYSLLVLNARRPIRSFGLEAHNTMEISIVRFL